MAIIQEEGAWAPSGSEMSAEPFRPPWETAPRIPVFKNSLRCIPVPLVVHLCEVRGVNLAHPVAQWKGESMRIRTHCDFSWVQRLYRFIQSFRVWYAYLHIRVLEPIPLLVET